MLPDNNEFSGIPFTTGFRFPVKNAGTPLLDWELGGITLNNPNSGLEYQVWTCYVVSSGAVQSVYVSAPAAVATLLFSATGITEVALAFDQNMNPFVAYMAAGTPKFYWYDPTATAMVHTALPAGSYDLRCTLDDKRSFNVADSDIVLSYFRNGILYMRYQRDRYEVEYTLSTGHGPDARLISMAMNVGSRMQWHIRSSLCEDPSAVVQVEPYLGDIVLDLCKRAGIARERIDVRELYNDTVPGLLVRSDKGFREQIEWLRDIFHFDKAAYDKKLFFPKRNREVSAWIAYNDLVATSPVALKDTLASEQKLPREVNVNHLDPTAGYAKNKQTASRKSNLVNARKVETVDTQLVLTPDQASTAALVKLKMYWNELIDFKFTTTLKYTKLTVTDEVMVEDASGVWHRVRLIERNEDGKLIEWDAKLAGGEDTYGTTAIGSTLRDPISTTPGLAGQTRFEVLNLPVLYDANDELGVFVAACGESSGWAGYQLLYSIDNGITYNQVFTAESPSVIGDTLTELKNEPLGYAYPSSQTVDVRVPYTLESVSYDQIQLRKNLCVIGDELLQFQTATLLATTEAGYDYRLSGLVRGRLNTATATWSAGVRFVLIDPTVIFLPVTRAFLGTDLWYKAVTSGTTVDETIPTVYNFAEGLSQTEFPVSNVTFFRHGTQHVTVNWLGAARLGYDGLPYHSKYFRGYRVKFGDGHTIDTYNQTADYLSAPVGTTVQICALNEITGEGPLSPIITT